jgi:hypothetical protein
VFARYSGLKLKESVKNAGFAVDWKSRLFLNKDF